MRNEVVSSVGAARSGDAPSGVADDDRREDSRHC